jgi:hypothetical protein
MLPDRGISVESAGRTAAAFFDLDKTIMTRSSNLAFVPSFYQHGLITSSGAIRDACAQLNSLASGARPERLEQIRAQLTGPGRD